jgi:tRNA pseudouridine38-40 synthase
VRELHAFEVSRHGPLIDLDLTASAFLPHQVRRMAGPLVEVGRGRLSVEAYVALLQGAAASAGPAAPPHGLYLIRVTYDSPIFESEDVC